MEIYVEKINTFKMSRDQCESQWDLNIQKIRDPRCGREEFPRDEKLDLKGIKDKYYILYFMSVSKKCPFYPLHKNSKRCS